MTVVLCEENEKPDIAVFLDLLYENATVPISKRSDKNGFYISYTWLSTAFYSLLSNLILIIP